MSLGSSFHQVQLAQHRFDEVDHLSRPSGRYFTAYELGSPPVRFAGFSTGPESVGEELADQS